MKVIHKGAVFTVKTEHDIDSSLEDNIECLIYSVCEGSWKRPSRVWVSICHQVDMRELVTDLRRQGVNRHNVHAEALATIKRVKAYYRDEWSYIGIVVDNESLWGIESDCSEHIKEVTAELTEQAWQVRHARWRKAMAFARKHGKGALAEAKGVFCE